jgi:phosphatidate phosphatase LPIN
LKRRAVLKLLKAAHISFSLVATASSMNYLRGAVSAISAPYQYYKDINPSTLTGAIDVIVISRPKLADTEQSDKHAHNSAEEERELVCSPFHVRFGKWQVLRPADKKVRTSLDLQYLSLPE